MRRRATNLLIGLFLLEAVLQIASVAVYLGARGDSVSQRDPSGARILCVGDSFTHGLGATGTERAYPAVLESLLDARGVPASVVNAGWPSQNSRELLLGLKARLVEHEPDVVLALVGMNDAWSRPSPVKVTDAQAGRRTDGWQLRWRTGRLVRWVLGGPAGCVALDPAAARGQDAFDRGMRLLGERRAAEAAALLEEALGTASEARVLEIHKALVHAYSQLGQREAAARSVRWLEEECARRPDEPRTRALAFALMVTGEHDRAETVARTGLERFPRSSTLWWISAEGHSRDGNLEQAERAFEEALETGAPRDANWRAIQLRGAALAGAARDPRKSIERAVRALLADRNVGATRGLFEELAPHLVRVDVGAVLNGLELSPADRALVREAMTGLGAAKTGELDVLRGHLRQIVALCREHGAEPVLMSYPLPSRELRAVQRGVAEETGAPFVPVGERFDAALRARAREELFVPDGHCTDAGYALLAEVAADVLVGILRR